MNGWSCKRQHAQLNCHVSLWCALLPLQWHVGEAMVHLMLQQPKETSYQWMAAAASVIAQSIPGLVSAYDFHWCMSCHQLHSVSAAAPASGSHRTSAFCCRHWTQHPGQSSRATVLLCAFKTSENVRKWATVSIWWFKITLKSDDFESRTSSHCSATMHAMFFKIIGCLFKPPTHTNTDTATKKQLEQFQQF